MRALVAGAALLLSGCATAQPMPTPAPDNPDQATSEDACGASRFRHLIGTPADQIDRATLPPRTRVLTPDAIVTMDFSAERLNIMVGTDGLVGSLRCF